MAQAEQEIWVLMKVSTFKLLLTRFGPSPILPLTTPSAVGARVLHKTASQFVDDVQIDATASIRNIVCNYLVAYLWRTHI